MAARIIASLTTCVAHREAFSHITELDGFGCHEILDPASVLLLRTGLPP
jgi:hypothetical protein